ncbi:MAG: ABC transporter ATP-binding protein [Eubacteriales bacterium]|nr:ABC transporter ATP-binding protein [Eubacteriales bacterium]
MNAIEIKNLCKSYTGFALQDLNLTLPRGTILGLIGENGAGKSTTMKLILDMIRRDSGTITILGRDNQADIRSLKEEIGVVLDEVGLPSVLNARQIGRVMKGTFRSWEEETYEGYLRRFSIPCDKPFRDFSRGTKMKLGIAVALSHRARLLILDEATSGLDPVIRDEILDIFNEFTRDEDHTILISSHIVSDLEKICDYVAFLHKGRLLLCEEKDKLKERYAIIHCSQETLEKIPKAAVIGVKRNAYGAEAIVERKSIPPQAEESPVDIEQLFIFMTKEAEEHERIAS